MLKFNIKNSQQVEVTIYDVIGKVVNGFESLLPKTYGIGDVEQFLNNEYNVNKLQENITINVENTTFSETELDFCIEKSYLMIIEKAIQTELNSKYQEKVSLNDIRGYLGTWGMLTEVNLKEVMSKANYLLVAFSLNATEMATQLKVA